MLTAFSSSRVRIWPRTSKPGFCSFGPNQPRSPRVAQTRYVSTPSAAYFASVPPIPIDSSSGWAKTQSNRKGSVIPLCLLIDTLELKHELLCDYWIVDDQNIFVV